MRDPLAYQSVLLLLRSITRFPAWAGTQATPLFTYAIIFSALLPELFRTIQGEIATW